LGGTTPHPQSLSPLRGEGSLNVRAWAILCPIRVVSLNKRPVDYSLPVPVFETTLRGA
jgi:hypothetical protein